MIQVICDICGEASQKPFGFRPENGLAFSGRKNPNGIRITCARSVRN